MTGAATIRGRSVAILLCEFGFLGGSIGVAAGDTAGRRHPASHRRAAAPAGACRRPGAPACRRGRSAFLQMVKITAARHRAQSSAPALPRLSPPPHHRRRVRVVGVAGARDDRRTGGARRLPGPARVRSACTATVSPRESRQSENLQAHGLIDAVRPPEQLAEIVDRALRIITDTPGCSASDRRRRSAHPESTRARMALGRRVPTRRPTRSPGTAAQFRAQTCCRSTEPARARTTPALHAGARSLRRHAVRPARTGPARTDCSSSPLGPGGAARSTTRYAAGRRTRPTAGDRHRHGGRRTVQGSRGRWVGGRDRSMHRRHGRLDIPTVSFLLGQGTGGGALALVPADRVLAAHHGWLSPLPPEGASAIVHRRRSRPRDGGGQGIRSFDLRRGSSTASSPNFPMPRTNRSNSAERVGTALHRELSDLMGQDADMRRIARGKRFDRIGSGTTVHARGDYASPHPRE